MDASLKRICVAWMVLSLLSLGAAVAGESSPPKSTLQPEPNSEVVWESAGKGSGIEQTPCKSCGSCTTPCCVGPGGAYWVRAEYLLWWTSGMATPPLVTAGPSGVLGDDETVILYGGNDLLDGSRSGFRIRLGTWLDCNRRVGIEGEYWRLGDAAEHFLASDTSGRPAIYRPFFNINPRDENDLFDPPAREDAELVAYPGILSGSVAVDARNRLDGAGAWLRYNLCCESSWLASCDPCFNPCSGPSGARFDFLIGYRYARLADQLTIREDLTSLDPPPNQGTFDITDSFGTSNDFHGVDLGVISELNYGRWSLELLGRLALGNVDQRVVINGQTIIDGSAISDGQYVGGLLAQRTNIGSYSRNEFAVLPQLGATLGYRVTPCLQATVGYSFLYLSRVVRAGEQIDLDVNPDLLPPEFTPFAGAERPSFALQSTDFWAQGLNFGLELAW